MLVDVNIDGRAGCTQIKREVRWKRGLLADTLVQLGDGLVVLPVSFQLCLQPRNVHSPLIREAKFVFGSKTIYYMGICYY